VPIQPIPAPVFRAGPLRLSLKQDEHPRQTTAMLCPLPPLLAWSGTVPTARLASLQGVHLGAMTLGRGNDLPLLAEGKRFWGRDILMPLGYAPELALPESALKLFVVGGLQEDEILLWQRDNVEVIERSLLSPLTRAGLRLAV